MDMNSLATAKGNIKKKRIDSSDEIKNTYQADLDRCRPGV